MVLSADGRCDINPIRTNAMSKQEVEHDIQAYKIKSVVYKYHLEKIKNIYRKNKTVKKRKKKKNLLRDASMFNFMDVLCCSQENI